MIEYTIGDCIIPGRISVGDPWPSYYCTYFPNFDELVLEIKELRKEIKELRESFNTSELETFFEQVESDKFSAEINVASGFKVFLYALEINETLKNLIEYLKENSECSEKVVERFLNVLADEGNLGFVHPHDAALAGYLYVINKVNPTLAAGLVGLVWDMGRAWWTKQYVSYLWRELNRA
jgi:hypothetical protein